jgi:reductive dehalogenase
MNLQGASQNSSTLDIKSMTEIPSIIAAVLLASLSAIALSFLISCIWEKERRASFFAALQFAGALFILILFFHLRSAGLFKTAFWSALLSAAILGACVVFYFLARRSPPNPKALQGTSGCITGQPERVDEREMVFARNRSIRPGSPEYEIFYKEHPGMEAHDAERRELGGPLGRLGAIDKPVEGMNVAAAMASLSIPLSLSSPLLVTPPFHPAMKGRKVAITPVQATEKVKAFARQAGADLVGITEINPLWVYSRRGEIFHENWEDWGKEVPLDHKYAVVFATEMDFRFVGAAPHTPTVIESMRNYAKGAYIAAQLAAYMSNLGYPATANHLRHYDAILVPLAVDAGLGEMGRLGYLMTKQFGPRVRLGAVTSNLPLIPDEPVDLGLEDFCRICRKCAVCCPSHSIPTGERQEVNGILRWKLNAETCFDYWGKIGTDCNVCMRVCPWSHARTFPHRIIVGLVSRNSLSRRVFNLMDDVFYGRKPKPKAPPAWARLKN